MLSFLFTDNLKYCLLIILLLTVTREDAGAQLFRADEERLADRALRRTDNVSELFADWHHVGRIGIDSIRVNRDAKIISLFFSNQLTYIPVRPSLLEGLRAEISGRLGFRFRNYNISLHAGGRELEEYIPNYYRASRDEADSARIIDRKTDRILVSREGRGEYHGGLSGSHIAVWPSHGYHYAAERDRWEWQRARLYGTVEDLYPFSFIQPYLVPMLENAGAHVLLPRERDVQHNEVIVDNDGSTGRSEIMITNGDGTRWTTVGGRGFALRDTLFEGDNPFRMGSHLRIKAARNRGAEARYIPDMPENGEYAVYVSWVDIPGNIDSVRYQVNYSGGQQVFYADQTMGGGTWIYLGTFHFFEGMDGEAGSVVVSGDSNREGFISTDAVRFGGGMGNVARKAADDLVAARWSLHDGLKPAEGEKSYRFPKGTDWKLSGRPRYMEGARYYLQYSGMPDSSVYSLTRGKNDYNDDFMARGEWINFLSGAPMGVTGETAPDSPLIPVRMALAFHTDAGVTPNDSVIGTLAIYSSETDGGVYHSGHSRLAARDLSDIVQTQIVEDIRLLVNENWTRRGLWDRRYSEAWRSQVPAMLLELLSHQNLADMSYGLDPRFKFIVSRSIYKGILRYLAWDEGREAVVQPLPPERMAMEKIGDKQIRLSWKGREDPAEPSASPESYRVYTRRENGGFDPGVDIYGNHLDIKIPGPGVLYSFKVTALNEGGESMPGEILSVMYGEEEKKPVLLVNAFTRVSGPSFFDKGRMGGIGWWEDTGVADRYDVSHTGVQYDFDRLSPWLHDDSPGWGASYADMEGKKVRGNSFDFPSLYGQSLRESGYSFISLSRKAFEENVPDPEHFMAVIVIFGQERGINGWMDPGAVDFRVLSDGMISSLKSFALNNKGIMLSGSYLGTDMIENNDSTAIAFARDYLGFEWRTNHATNTGGITVTGPYSGLFPGKLNFNVSYDPEIYPVPAPDAIEAAGEAVTVYRYESNGTSAGVVKTGENRVVALGFPVETIVCYRQRTELIKGVMEFFAGQ